MKKIFTLRHISQAIVLVAVFILSLRHMNLGIEKAAPIDAFCPFGAVEGFWTYLVTGEYLRRINTSSFLLLGIVVALTLAFGRVFCGFFCPLGTLQEWLRGLGRKMGIKKDLELPASIDKYARYLKYGVLATIIYFSYKVGDLVFRNYDPYNALMHLGEEFEEKQVAYIILAVVLFLALFAKSWWCRYFCPLGAALAIIRKISPFKIVRNKATCIGCHKCDRTCPANLPVEQEEVTDSADCVSCLRCVSDCPNSSLTAQVGKKKVSKKLISIITIVAFAGLVGLAVASPYWQTKPESNLKTTTGAITTENIRGSNTLQYVIDQTGVPLEKFVHKLKLPKDVDTSLMLKEIGPKYDLKDESGAFLETEAFREVITEVQGE